MLVAARPQLASDGWPTYTDNAVGPRTRESPSRVPERGTFGERAGQDRDAGHDNRHHLEDQSRKGNRLYHALRFRRGLLFSRQRGGRRAIRAVAGRAIGAFRSRTDPRDGRPPPRVEGRALRQEAAWPTRGYRSSGRLAPSRATSKANLAKVEPADALSDDTRLDFIDTPLNQAVQFLMDLHDVRIQSLADDDPPVTLSVRGLPLHLALTMMTQRLNCDWCADREAIFVGPRDKLARIERTALPGLRRWSRLGIAATDVTQALRTDTRLDVTRISLDRQAAGAESVRGGSPTKPAGLRSVIRSQIGSWAKEILSREKLPAKGVC